VPTLEAIGRLGTEAVALRDACLAALATIDIVPDAYLYPGSPPIEVGEPPCDGMLAVYVPTIGRLPTNTGTGPLAGQAPLAQNPRVPSITYTVVYAMCVDTFGDASGAAPDPDYLTEQTLRHTQAGWVLMNGIVYANRREMLFTTCRNFALGALTPIAVQGNAAGWSFDVTVQMDGFDPFAPDG
jgi:hypothetical protein